MTVKGWCPGAWRPMLSGDGLLMRVRPRLGQLSRTQALGLCAVSQRFGNGVIDLTSRANLQIRGVAEADHDAARDALNALRLLDPTPEAETRRNILVTPLWSDGDRTAQLHAALCAALPGLPALPAKMGYAIDGGMARLLADAPADIRLEPSVTGGLLVRADGAPLGRAVTLSDAPAALRALAAWFVDTGGRAAGRMARHLATVQLPPEWAQVAPAPTAPRPAPGAHPRGWVYGAAFGSLEAAALARLITDSGATALRTTPWRMILLEGARACPAPGFLTRADDPLLQMHACPGAPACSAATVATRSLARHLAQPGLHVSGCAKGCAHPRPAPLTLVGRDGTFDLVEHGHPWDAPRQRGLTATDLLTPAT